MRKLIYNGTIINEGKCVQGFIVIDGKAIAEVGEGKPGREITHNCYECIDAGGAYILPGVIDDHVHFREPGMTHKADIASESRAAVAGGVTSFMDMPNNKPFTTTLETLEAKYEKAAQVSRANYSFYIGATNDNIDVIKTIDFAKVCGVKAFLGTSTGGMLVSDAHVLRRLFQEVGTVIAVHSEDEDIINANRERLVARLGDDLPLKYHEVIRSAEACYVSTRRTVELARECGTRLHVLHVSTAREIDLLDGKNITGEATVPHLLFSDEDYERLGNRIKCNPAVKTPQDRETIRQAVCNGKLSVIATDHAPHLPGEKQGGCLKAASGMPLVQFSLIAMLELAHQGVFTPQLVVERMCHAPARLYGIEKRGFLRKGYRADVALVETVEKGWTVTDSDVISKCGWTPLDGMVMHHRVKMTFVNGQLACADGKVNDNVRGERLSFKH